MSDQTVSDGVPDPSGQTNLIKTDYKIGQQNLEGELGPFGFDIHNPVFMVSAASVIVFIILTLLFLDQASAVFNAIFSFVTTRFDWLFISAGNIFVLFCLALIVSPWGSVRLGGSAAKPDFSYASWFAMLFAAGMGIGLMFFGVLEPVYHAAVSQPLGTETLFNDDGTINQSARADAVAIGLAGSIYHWGLHPWAIYGVVALALSLFAYNKGLPLSIRSAFYPILGERIWGFWGHVIDTLAVFATLFGLTTSLGLGAQQANAGLSYVYGLPQNVVMQIAIIAGVTAIALWSVLRGVDGGVKRLSEINMFFAAVLLLFVFFVGGAVTVLQYFGIGLWNYVTEGFALSNPVGREDDSYRQAWTAFYWSWWISWSPFVGMFIARVSRGRTVREFLTCVLLIPSLVSVFWMATFGGIALDQVLTNTTDSAVYQNVIANYNDSQALFAMLESMPFAAITSTLAIILVLVFFITSSDSGSLVIDVITAGGKMDAPIPQRVFWCTFEGIVAIVLLLGGGLSALQSMTVSTGLPFTIVLLLMCYSIVRGLMSEKRLAAYG